MNDSIIQIMLDMQELSNLSVVYLKKGDTARKIIITLSDGGFPYVISKTSCAVLSATKPDGHTLFNYCTIDENKIIYEVTQQTTAAVGKMRCEIRLIGPDNAVLNSASFLIIVGDTVTDEEVPESSSEFTALTQLMSEVIKITKEEGAILMLYGATEETLRDIRDKLGHIETGITGAVQDMNSFQDVANAVRAGKQGLTFNHGDQLITAWRESTGSAEYEDPFDVVQVECAPELKNGEIVHGMMLQQHYANVRACPFDAQEALYDADAELSAGTYHFTVADNIWIDSENGKVIQFTLTKPVPAGGQLVYANAEGYNAVIAGQKINTYSGPTSFEPIESVTLSEGSGGTDLGITDGKGALNHHQAAFRGSGRWMTSMLRQYLNSDKPAGAWWTKQAKWDRASAFINTCPGYMAGFPADFLAAIKPVKVQTARDTVISDGGTDITYDYFFPVSLEQMNIDPQITGVEGQALPYWKEVAAADTTGNLDTSGRFKRGGTYPDLRAFGLDARTTYRNCWMRSTNRAYSCIVYLVYSVGYISDYGFAASECSCAPACVIC